MFSRTNFFWNQLFLRYRPGRQFTGRQVMGRQFMGRQYLLCHWEHVVGKNYWMHTGFQNPAYKPCCWHYEIRKNYLLSVYEHKPECNFSEIVLLNIPQLPHPRCFLYSIVLRPTLKWYWPISFDPYRQKPCILTTSNETTDLVKLTILCFGHISQQGNETLWTNHDIKYQRIERNESNEVTTYPFLLPFSLFLIEYSNWVSTQDEIWRNGATSLLIKAFRFTKPS
jgi:hypothetical protein